MTDLTRRDALMLTAAIAATTTSTKAAAQAPANNGSLPDDNTLLTVPSGTVANTSIPISLKIPVATFAPPPNNVVPSRVQIAVTATDLSTSPTAHAVFTATLQGMAALPAFNKNQTPAITLMTRLKVDWDKTTTSQTPQTNVVATVTMTYPDGPKTVKASQKVTLKNEDCAAPDISVLRLSFQPPTVQPKASVMVRAIVPPVATTTNKAVQPPAQIQTHNLKQISGANDDGQFLVVKIDDDSYLSAEVFVGFGIIADKTQKITMEWQYAPNAVLPAPAPPAYVLDASGRAVVDSNAPS